MMSLVYQTQCLLAKESKPRRLHLSGEDPEVLQQLDDLEVQRQHKEVPNEQDQGDHH
jgi:hypothetical protein